MRCLLFAWLTLLSASSFAQTPDPDVAARGDRLAGQAAFRVGVQAFRANRFAVAAQTFEQAYEADPRPETAFSIAQANRLQYYRDRISWRVQRALQLYQVYLEKLPSGPRARDALDRIGELEPILGELRRRGELVPYVVPAKTQVVIGADGIESAKVTIDGRIVQLWEPVDVAPGTHEVVVEADGFEPARRRVVIALGRFLPVDVTLRAKPGRLTVRSEEGATVHVDGRRIGALPLAPSAISPGTHFLSVTRRGRVAWNDVITIGRDQALVVDAALEPSGQRRAAWWVLGAGVAVGSAAGATALWAYAARRDANALDDKRKNLTATPADLARYNQRVADTRFRSNVAVGLGIGAAAIVVVGAGLWWFDSPTPGSRPRVDVTPIVGADELGVALGAKF